MADTKGISRERWKILSEIEWWLEGDLFERKPTTEPGVTYLYESPLGWQVVLSVRQDKKGYAGEVRSPDGKRLNTTSWVDINWLDEYLP